MRNHFMHLTDFFENVFVALSNFRGKGCCLSVCLSVASFSGPGLPQALKEWSHINALIDTMEKALLHQD